MNAADRYETYAELHASFSEHTRALIERLADEAPPFPPESAATLRRILTGAGERILARRAEKPDRAA